MKYRFDIKTKYLLMSLQVLYAYAHYIITKY